MDESLLVEVFVRTGAGKGELATGYPVAKNRVITARHTVFPPGKNVDCIELRWYYQNGEFKETVVLESPPACIAWDGGEKFDVVLLDCQLPVTETGRLSREKPSRDMLWQGIGFAKAGEQGKLRPPTKMWGTMADAKGPGDFVLGVESPPAQAEYWKGASGSPVFVNGEIIGIIESYPENFGATRLKATPIWKLLEIPKFYQSLGEEYAQKEWLQTEIVSLLKQHDNYCKYLAERLELDRNQPDVLANILLSSASDAFEKVNKIFREAVKDQDKQRLEWMRTLLGTILPARLDASLIESLRQQKHSGCLMVSLEIATIYAAETAMAGSERRATQFCVTSDQNNITNKRLKAILAIDNPPEVGIDDSGDRFVQALQEQLIDISAVRKSLVPNQAIDYDELLGTAADELQYLANQENRTYYFMYALPDEQRCQKNIAKIKSRFPSLIFIHLIGKNLQQENRDFRPLRKLWGVD